MISVSVGNSYNLSVGIHILIGSVNNPAYLGLNVAWSKREFSIKVITSVMIKSIDFSHNIECFIPVYNSNITQNVISGF